MYFKHREQLSVHTTINVPDTGVAFSIDNILYNIIITFNLPNTHQIKS